MADFLHFLKGGRNGCYATVVYNNQQSAAYAKEKIHGLEYPPGERLIVKAGLDLKIMGNINPDNIFPFDGKFLLSFFN